MCALCAVVYLSASDALRLLVEGVFLRTTAASIDNERGSSVRSEAVASSLIACNAGSRLAATSGRATRPEHRQQRRQSRSW